MDPLLGPPRCRATRPERPAVDPGTPSPRSRDGGAFPYLGPITMNRAASPRPWTLRCRCAHLLRRTLLRAPRSGRNPISAVSAAGNRRTSSSSCSLCRSPPGSCHHTSCRSSITLFRAQPRLTRSRTFAFGSNPGTGGSTPSRLPTARTIARVLVYSPMRTPRRCVAWSAWSKAARWAAVPGLALKRRW